MKRARHAFSRRSRTVRVAGGYSLGPHIIELDWHIRRFDPVLAASRPIVRDLAARSGCNVTQMSMYGDRIVTIHHEPGAEPLEINFGCGRSMPLFRGAPSRAILAFLPRARLKRLYERHRDDVPPEAAAWALSAWRRRCRTCVAPDTP